MVELVGARVVLRPLRSDDWDAWREVRQRVPGLARAVGAGARVRERGSRRSIARRSASRCGAWERQRHFDAAYGFGLFLTDGTLRGRGEPRQRAARARSRWATSATGSTKRSPGAGTSPKGSCCSSATRSRRCGCTASRRRSFPATRASRRVAEKLGLRDEGIALQLPADPGHLRGPHPLRDDRRGVARARPRAGRRATSHPTHPSPSAWVC